jgi:hypothetical protein
MPTLPHLKRRRLFLVGLLLVAGAALVAVRLLTAPGPLEKARAKYGRIERGMRLGEVMSSLDGWSVQTMGWMGPGGSARMEWLDPLSGASVWVEFDFDGKVTEKDFDEGDQSLRAKVQRFKGRLADRLHRGP